MKVSINIPDDLLSEVKNLTHGKNTTDSLVTALKEWVAIQRIRKLNEGIKRKPLEFASGFTAKSVRMVNRA